MARKGQGQQKEHRPKEEFEQRIIDLARVTRVMAGGKRLRFRACMVIGDHKGRVGYGIAKGADVALAISKAVARAKKNMLQVLVVKDSLPHSIKVKYKSALVLLKPAPSGTGIIAGGAVRQVLELAGIPNVVAKILGCNNKVTNVKAVFAALDQMQTHSGNRKIRSDKNSVVEKNDASSKPAKARV